MYSRINCILHRQVTVIVYDITAKLQILHIMYCACDRQAGRSVCVSTQPYRPVLILTVCIEDNSHMMKMVLKMSAYAGVILLTF